MKEAQGVTTWAAVNSHLCVMIDASVALSQSQHIGVSHYLPAWLCPQYPIHVKALISYAVFELCDLAGYVKKYWLVVITYVRGEPAVSCR